MASVEVGVRAFQDTCLSGLPDFKSVPKLAKQAKMASFELPELDKSYVLTGYRVFVGTGQKNGIRLCVLTIDSKESARKIGSSFLKAAQQETGSGNVKKYKSSFFNYANQLSNGSVITHDVRKKSGFTRSIFTITSPVSEDQIQTLIYN